MIKKYQSNLILIFLITILTLYIVNSNLITTGILDYTKLFFTKLFPTSFIIFTISSLLINYQLIEFLSKTIKSNCSIIYITIMSMVSGFPSGAKYTKELYEKNYISKEDGNYLLTYTHFPNPIFILGPVNKIIKDKRITLILFASILLSNLIVSLIFKHKTNETKLPKYNQENFSKALNNAIFSSLKTIILVYGTSLFFYLISLILTHYFKLFPILYCLINGFFDLTKGIFSTTIISSTTIKSLLILLFISFGSISIHIQIKSILSDTLLNYKNFIIGRFISTILSLIIYIVLLFSFKIAI